MIIYKTELSQITLWIFKCHRKIVSLIGNSVRNINFINWKKRKNCRQNRFSRTRLAGHLFQSKGARRWNREGWLTSAKSHATLSGCGPTGPQSFPRPPLQALFPSSPTSPPSFLPSPHPTTARRQGRILLSLPQGFWGYRQTELPEHLVNVLYPQSWLLRNDSELLQ